MKKLIVTTLLAASLLGGQKASAVTQDVARDGAQVQQVLSNPLRQRIGGILHNIHEVELNFPIGQGEQLHSVIKFTLAGLIQRRVVLLLPGPVENINTFNYDVEGFNALDILADANYVAVAMDPYGNELSSKPADGTAATVDAITARYKRAMDRLKFIFNAPKIDVYGEGGMGGLVCLQLARDAARTNSCSSSGQLYKYPSQFVQDNLFSPFVYFSLINQIPGSPFNTVNGFLNTAPIAPIVYGGATVGVPPEVAADTLELQPGQYPTGYFLEGFKVVGIPSGVPEVVVDAKPAKVPGLVITDEFDAVSLPGDNEALVAEYGATGGGDATLKVIAGSSAHAPRLGITEGDGPDSPFWTYLLDFLDSVH